MTIPLAMLLNFVFFFATANGASRLGNENPVTMDGAPPGVVWAVQMSDIHLSKWTPSRGLALRKALSQTLKSIRPAVVLVTGDLTDAKSKDMSTTRQDEEEWIEYRDSFLQIAKNSGIPLQNFYDLRGNHDKYGVPPGSPLDYFSKYSISASLNRSSLVQSVTVQGGDGRKHLFVGFDDSMLVGLRGPSNLFGHQTDEILAQLDQKLKSWDHDGTPVTKIVYGHFPMSFTTSSETGKRVEDVMASNNVTAYVCGHLHTAFGRHLYRHHKERTGDFWEWEMGDWRLSRMMRVLAIDHGHTSFVDVELLPPSAPSDAAFTMPTIVLQTYPLDSRFQLPHSPQSSPPSNSIRALVFSATPPDWVYATVYDSRSGARKTLLSTLMKETPQNVSTGVHYYTASWDQERSAPRECSMQIAVRCNGRMSYSDMRLVSGQPRVFLLPFWSFLVLGVKWEIGVPFCLWSTVILLLVVLAASWMFCAWLQEKGKYEGWMTAVFRPPWTLGKAGKRLFAGLVELHARDGCVWALVALYVVYMGRFPWFWGNVLADGFPAGSLSIFGWTVKPSNGHSVDAVSGLGVPDFVVIVMSYLWGVIVPVTLVVAVLAAERTAFEIDRKILGKCLRTNAGDSQENGDAVVAMPGAKQIDERASLIKNSSECRGDVERKLWNSKARIALLGSCVVIAVIHSKLCLTIGRSFGFSTLATAPVYGWFVPVLLVFAFSKTGRVRCRCTRCLKP